MKVYFAPQLEFTPESAAPRLPAYELERYGSAHVDDESRETVGEAVRRLILERRESLIGAEPTVDAPSFTEELWWPALVERHGRDIAVLSFPLSRAYGVDAAGHVYFDYPRSLRVCDLLRAMDDGNYRTSEHCLVVTRTGEFGGNGHPVESLVLWLLQELPIVLLSVGIDRRLLRRDEAKQLQLQQLAADWASRHIQYPHELRGYVCTRTGWYAEPLGRRLEISADAAGRLLISLGYEVSDDDAELFMYSESEKARAARREWLDAESAVTFATLDELLESDLDRPEQPVWDHAEWDESEWDELGDGTASRPRRRALQFLRRVRDFARGRGDQARRRGI